MPKITAEWVEVSNDFVKLVFICPTCEKETKKTLGDAFKTGRPLCCACEGTPMGYKTTLVYM